MGKTAKKRGRRKMRIYRLVAFCVKHLLNKDMDYKRREEDRKVLSCAKVYHKTRQQGRDSGNLKPCSNVCYPVRISATPTPRSPPTITCKGVCPISSRKRFSAKGLP